MAMRRLVAEMPSDFDETEIGLVHYEGCAQISAQTLCGHTDRVQWTFVETKKRVNCIGCISVRNHVMGK